MKVTWKKCIVGLFSFAIIMIMYKAARGNGILNIDELFTNASALGNMYYISQIIASLFVAIGVLVAGWQYVLTSRSEIAKNRNEKVQKAIDLSEYYKDHILDKYCMLFCVFSECNMIDIINEVKITKMNNFDIYELQDNFSTSQLDKLAEINESKEFAKVVVAASIRFNVPLNKNLFKATEVDEDGEKHQAVRVDAGAIVNDFMNGIVCEVLNNMEFFAMHFTHNVADETVVYQSLHKTYLEMVRVLYYNIAKNNKDAQKLYTNVIELFNKWKKESLAQQHKVMHGTRGAIIKGSVGDSIK